MEQLTDFLKQEVVLEAERYLDNHKRIAKWQANTDPDYDFKNHIERGHRAMTRATQHLDVLWKILYMITGNGEAYKEAYHKVNPMGDGNSGLYFYPILTDAENAQDDYWKEILKMEWEKEKKQEQEQEQK
jgi:hypothetical protein